ncbi:MAG: disulfide bond formation protein B [bacterium]|nr:MAG: disulfide bond formation protein B [bacterium]
MTEFLSVLTIIAQVQIIILLVLMYLNRKKKSNFFKKIVKFADIYTFIIALVSMLGSLYYSEIAGFEPCKYCWYQRILMYPLVVILFVSLKNRYKDVSKYVLPLSGMGVLLAGFHYLTQLGLLPSSCVAVGYSVGCAKVFVMTFGYITIPLMSFTAFLLIFLLQLLSRNR